MRTRSNRTKRLSDNVSKAGSDLSMQNSFFDPFPLVTNTGRSYTIISPTRNCSFKVTDPEDPSWYLWWCEINDVRPALDLKLAFHQKVPHFRNHYELTRKNYLHRNLKRYKKSLLKANKMQEAELCDCMPLTFELPNDYRLFTEEYHKQPGATWIVKPAGRSQGRGILNLRTIRLNVN